jgi:hypothetical protein
MLALFGYFSSCDEMIQDSMTSRSAADSSAHFE